MTRTLTAVALLAPLCLAAMASAQAKGSEPALPAYSEKDWALAGELVAGLRPDVAAGGLVKAEAAAEVLKSYLARPGTAELLPKWLAWAKAELAHPVAGWVGDRTATLLVFGPPGGIHREGARAWSGETGHLAASAWDLMLQDSGQDPRSPAEELELSWEMPTEIWVYPDSAGGALTVFYFADLDGDGVKRRVLRKQMSSSERVSSAPFIEVPASLFGAGAAEVQVQTLEGAQDLPALSDSPVGVVLDVAYFKATEGRTAARFVVAVDPDDLELELDVEPATYMAGARIWLRVAKDGAPVYQDVFEPNPDALAQLSSGYVDELTTVPLPPGTYQVSVTLTDGEGRGGSTEQQIELPDMEAPLALSSLILTKAEGGEIPKASSGEEDFVAFRVGSYVARPHVSGELRAGDSLALVVQVYSAAGGATLEYDLYKDGRAANSLEPVRLKTLPATDIQVIEVLDVWPAGSYAFKLTASAGSESLSREVRFRVRK